MDYSTFYKDPITGEVNTEWKAKFDKSSKKFSNQMKRHTRRVNLVTEKLNPPSYFQTDVYLAGLKNIPVNLYEPSLDNNKSSVNLLDYVLITLEQITGEKYEYIEYKKAISRFVEIFNIPPDESQDIVIDGRRRRAIFEGENGKYYNGKALWFHVCRRVLKQEKSYHRKQIIKKLTEDGKQN